MIINRRTLIVIVVWLLCDYWDQIFMQKINLPSLIFWHPGSFIKKYDWNITLLELNKINPLEIFAKK